MKKETVIAIFFGVIFGGLVAVFLLAKNKELQLNKAKTIAPTGKAAKAAKNIVANLKSLEILEPKDGAVFNSKTVSIKGKADNGSLIVIQSATKELVMKNEKGEFTVSFPLALGENLIKITAYLKDSKVRPQERELRIFNLDDEL
ncbi:hypothetical protein A2767_06410 [Candidatus Roizmanbacteria bacterium RIFCSPHIGHO2_01_FULL_35_10]|uniref:Bacterial Ig domain-containing protein n=1 Tax=Candidatus Roizmanbacteria bacterium RIFCSPLOWO2_01_FULL_35_13 TaxID=1802055 RepID=A0A1F7I820_9BACT|nr:MAG: hypothetical protein A2767_06410 [Candidatus Roizmanbacteria bacterium RIFCSPHIGHO2_01_FULL_35_10]OGK39527.1 MAG: hypothetical protein A3A74_00730 [Candidatus Roizmanbacteria bacterium RIFCSPLOWO2_01_FULL_35_13]